MACKARGDAHGGSLGEARNAAGRSQSLVPQGLRLYRALAASNGSARSYGYDLHHLSCDLPDGGSNATYGKFLRTSLACCLHPNNGA